MKPVDSVLTRSPSLVARAHRGVRAGASGLLLAAAASAALGHPAAAPAATCPQWSPSPAWTSQTVSRGARQFGNVGLAIAGPDRAVVAWGPAGELAVLSRSGRFSAPRALGRGRVLALQAATIDEQAVIAARTAGAIRLARVTAGGRLRALGTVRADRSTDFVLAGGRRGLLTWTVDGRPALAPVGARALGRTETRPPGEPTTIAAATSGGAHRGFLLVSQGSPDGRGLTISEREWPGPWQAPAALTATGSPGSVGAIRSALGGAALIWQATPITPDARSPGAIVVEGQARRPGGRWGAPRTFSRTGAAVTAPPQLAASTRGRGFAVWSESQGARRQVMAAEHVPGGDWLPGARVLFGTRRFHTPVAAMGAGGRHVAVVAAIACGRRVALVARRRAGVRWRASETIATWVGYVPQDLRVAVDAAGAITVAYTRRPRPGGGLRRIPVVVARRPA